MSGRRAAAFVPDVLLALALVLLTLAAAPVALRSSRPLLLEIGPNDADRVSGFRADWERDRLTRFRWTSTAAWVEFPAVVTGEGHVLRMRVRRHFEDPAHVRLKVEGRTISAFDLAADPKVAYRIVEVPLPALGPGRPLRVVIEAPGDVPRPLGIAVDWVEVERRGAGAVSLLPSTRLRWVGLVVAVFAALRLARAGRVAASVGAGVAWAALAWGFAGHLVAAERIVREGAPALVLLLALAVVLVRSRAFTATTREWPAAAAVLVGLVLVAGALRLVLVLHPQAYYPDIRIHSVFAWMLGRRGLAAFLREYLDNQFRFSLGLQREGGHWYAFPYPPGFYLGCLPLLRAGYRPEVAVGLLAALANVLTVPGAFVLARLLRQSVAVAVGAAAVATLLPLYFVRLSLAYYPAMLGHTIDLGILLFLLARLERDWRTRDGLAFSALIALALLAYTQSMLNFAMVLGPFLVLDALRDRTAPALRRNAWIVAGCVLGGLLALGVFYHRYLPAIADMHAGRAMAGESIALERLEKEARQARALGEPVVADDDDPYAGPDLDLLRGARKASWRMWVFYGPFSVAVVAGLLVLGRRLSGAPARLVACWALAYVLLNLASGGLPGPNLVRYNKDLELVAPLFCVGLAALPTVAGRLAAAVGGIGGMLYAAWAARRALSALTDRFSLER